MPDTYLDSSVVGFNHQDALDANVDTYRRLSPILNPEDKPALDEKFAYNLSILSDGPSKKVDGPKIDFHKAIVSDDPVIKEQALKQLQNEYKSHVDWNLDLGRSIESPYDDVAKKFIGKKFGYSAISDNEDFYYQNQYMADNWAGRWLVKNPAKFIARTVIPGVLKLGEGFGYVGSLLTSIGSDDYWADVADNGMSKWLEGLEQTYKDQVIPIYKEAGFDEKGFFSKLVDWSFWNNDAADAVAFMASAAIPGTAIAKLGKIGAIAGELNAFGKAFSTTSKVGKLASKVGLGSWAELSSWTFNTAMEASVEGSGVFKEVTRKLKKERDAGLNDFSDETIRQRAGKMAANTIGGNFAILALSNAWENTLFFKPFKNIKGRAAIQLGEDVTASSKALDAKGLFAPLGRTAFYGKQFLIGTISGTMAEGLWEENAQLAIQRINQHDNEGRNFLEQYVKQIGDAVSGKDQEAAESIGLGALIGIGTSVGFSKLANERKSIIKNTKAAIHFANKARQDLFNANDIYERDEKGIVFDAKNNPKIDAKKLEIKKGIIVSEYNKLVASNPDLVYQSEPVQYKTKQALANYVRSLNNIGDTKISEKLASVSPETAILFGMNPNDIKQQSAEFAALAEKFEDISKEVDDIPYSNIPEGTGPNEFNAINNSRKARIYTYRTDNEIFKEYLNKANSDLLQSINTFRNLSNASLSQFPIDQLNILLVQKKMNNDIMNHESFDDKSDLEKQYHIDYDKDMTDSIERYKQLNDIMLKDSKVTPNGYYVPTITLADGSIKESTFSTISTGFIKKIANYTTVIDKNEYFAKLLSSKDGYQKFIDLEKDSLSKAIDKIDTAIDTAIKEKSNKYKEQKPGDLLKVTNLVAKMVFGTNPQYSPEELQLQQNYAKLIEDLLPKYEAAIDNQLKINQKEKLKTLNEELQILSTLKNEQLPILSDALVELEIRREELAMDANRKQAIQRTIKKAIKELEEKIAKSEEIIKKGDERLAKLNTEISLLEQEITGGDFKGLWGSLAEMKKERDYISDRLNKTKTLLDEVKEMLALIVKEAKKLFGKGFEKDLKYAYSDGIEYIAEVKSRKEQIPELKKAIDELTRVGNEINAKHIALNTELNSVLKKVNDQFIKEYIDLTKDTKPAIDANEVSITDGITSDKDLFPTGSESQGGLFDNPKTAFDGSTYQRPLATKFFTTTFPNYENSKIKDLPKDVQDYFAFTNYVTTASKDELSKKLGDGDLRVIIVTRNNVDALKLRKVINGDEFFANNTPETTLFKVIPVIFDGGYFYYVDSELNKIGKVGDEPSSKLVRADLRLPRFTDKELPQYMDMVRKSSNNNLEDSAVMDILKGHIKTATDWRAKILEETAKSPTLNFDFSITRGIANLKRLEDGSYAKNPVSTILPEEDITGTSVQVYSNNTSNQQINGENVVLPIGRPFIVTKNPVNTQLHAADNNKLTDNQIKAVSLVLQEMIKDHLTKVQKLVDAGKTSTILKDRIKEVGIANLTVSEKIELYKQLTKFKPLFNSSYTNYLSSILYFNKLEKDENGAYKEPHKNQVHFKSFFIRMGNSNNAIDLTRPEDVMSKEVQDFLASQYHNVKYFTNVTKANKEYIEYFVKDEKMTTRRWKTYSHYLLSSKYPDGSKRTDIPITTAIKTKDQKAIENDGDPYYQYESRGIAIKPDDIIAVTKKVEPTKKEEDKKQDSKNEVVSSTDTDMPSSIGAFLKAKQEGKVKKSDNPILDALKAKQEGKVKKPDNPILDALNKKKQAAGKTTEETEEKSAPEETKSSVSPDDLPKYDQDDDTDSLPMAGLFRIAKAGMFKTEEDLDAVIAEIARMIPQFPVVRIKKAIQTMDGGEAWGQFVNNIIKLYEFAEEGTGYHEVFEAVANRLLTTSEWKAMTKEFRNREGYFTDRESGIRFKYSDSKVTDQQVKEEIAEEFRRYKLNNKEPKQPQTKSIFKMFLDWIKKLFGARDSIATVFDKIDQGKFAKRSLRATDRFTSNYRRYFPEMHPKVKRDLMDGATAFMFNQLFLSRDSITQLDEITLIDEDIYEPIRSQFVATVNGLTNLIAQENKKDSPNEELIVNYSKSISYINQGLDNWKDFVAAHKETIKKYNVSFEEEETNEKVIENQNRNDYTRNIFRITGKKSASKSVKFLFGSLLQKRFDKQGSVDMVGDTLIGRTVNIPSAVYLPNLVNSDKYMLDALELFKGISDMDEIERRLKDISGIATIEKIKNPEERANQVALLTKEQAAWTSLYVRIFGFSKNIDEEAAWNLKAKVQSYLSKQCPDPMLVINGGSGTSIISAVSRGVYENITRTIESSLISKQSLLFVKRIKDGVKTYVPTPAFQKKLPFDPVNDENGNPLPYFDAHKITKFVEYLGLESYINQDTVSLMSKDQRNKLKSLLLQIRNELTKANTTSINIRSLDIFGYTDSLIKFLENVIPNIASKESQLYNVENQLQSRHVTPSFASRIMDDINNLSRKDLLEKYPQMKSVFARDSIVLEKLADKNIPYSVSLGYINGIKDIDEGVGTSISGLAEHDKYWIQFNASLRGIYYSLPADSETEWTFNFGEFISYSENILSERGRGIIVDIFLPKLRSEIDLALSNSSKLLELNKVFDSTGRTAGNSLRFFKDILANDKKLLAGIHKDISENMSSEAIIKHRKKAIIASIASFINSEANITKNYLIDNRLAVQDGDKYRIKGVDSKFIEANNSFFAVEDGAVSMIESQLDSFVQYQKINSMIGMMEQFKLIYGDPAQYKDWEKRAKSLFSPVEQTFYDSTGLFNKWLTENKNYAVLGDEKVIIDDGLFSKEYTDKIKTRTVNDITVTNVATINSLISLDSKFSNKYIKKYEETNEADGQSAGTLMFFRELMIKSGWRWTKEHEEYYQYDTALMRSELSEIGKYDYKGNTKLMELDRKIVDFYKENLPTKALSPNKTLMSSVTEDGNQVLLKHSVYPISYQLAKEFELLDVYLDMLKRNDDLINFKSAQKVGLLLDDEDKVTDYYADPFTKNDLIAKGNPQFELDFRTIGIQIETQTSGTQQRLGSQLSKDINLNMFENGVPLDFSSNNKGSLRKIEWENLTHEKRLEASEYYGLVYGKDGTIRTLEDMKLKNTIDRLTKLGIKWEYSTTKGFTFDVNDLTKVHSFIKDELQRLDIDENSIENIALSEDLKTFRNPAETIPSYTVVSNVLWSLADKSVTSMSVNGKQYIQVASTFFNKSSRKAAYKGKNGRWIEVSTKEEYDRLKAEGEDLVLTSSELEFYRKDKNGNTLPMEVYLPNIYLEKVNTKRKSKGLPQLTDTQLLEHLNNNPKLLEGLGFRIPTQATSSLEFFKIKGFLPSAFGSSIVVPSGITTKAGSDFDVDKLSTYLNNWKLSKDGLPYYEEYKDDTNSNSEERYISYVKSNTKDFSEIFREMRGSSEFLRAKSKIDEIYDEKEDEIDEIEDLKKDIKSTYRQGYKLFKNLPLSVKQQYWEREDKLSDNLPFVAKLATYYQFTKEFISLIEGNKPIVLPLKITDKKTDKVIETTETIYPNEVIPIMKDMLVNYNEVVEKIGIKSKAFEELKALVAKIDRVRNKEELSFKLEVSNVVAEATGLMTIDIFEDLPLSLQNTKGALENRYFQSIRNILSRPDMFEYLLSPNSIDHIKENRDHVFEALDKKADETKELNFSKFLSTEYIAAKRHQFLSGKSDIGIGAVAMTNYANSQIVGLGIHEDGGVKKYDSFVFDVLNNSSVRLPFSDVNMLLIDGKWMISLSALQDKEGKYTMDKLSSYINGFVDVAKEPYIVEMGMHRELAGVYMLMERMGLTGKTTSLFLYNPIIRDYLKEKIFKNSYFGESSRLSEKDLIIDTIKKYGLGKQEFDPEYKLTDDQLAGMIKNGTNPNHKWSESEKKAMYMTFISMLKMKIYSNNLLTNIQASNHDTAGIRNHHIITRKDIQMKKSKQGNLVVAISGNNIINGAEALRNKTFNANDVTLLKAFDTIFSKMGLFALRKDNPKQILDAIAERILNQNLFISNDDFISAMREYEYTMIDSLVNNILIEGVDADNKLVENPLYKYAKQLFKSSSASSIGAKWNKIKSNPDLAKYVKGNGFLSLFDVKVDQNLELTLMELKKKPTSDDILTKELITDGLRELSKIDEQAHPELKELADFYKSVIYGAYIQFGIKFSRTSFLDLIPSEDLTSLTNPGLAVIDTADLSTLDEQVQRISWHNKKVVKRQTQYSVYFVSPDSKGNHILEEHNSRKTGNTKPPPISSQSFFIRKNIQDKTTKAHLQPLMRWGGYMENPIIWEDMDDIIAIPMVHPDHYQYVESEYDGQKSYGVRVSPEVTKMIKKGDFSYIYVQLYKKVGLEDPRLARQMITGKGDKKSINYLYKPINKYEGKSIKEIVPLIRTIYDTIIGEKSIITTPPFEELEDNELVSSIINSPRLMPITSEQAFNASSNSLRPIPGKPKANTGKAKEAVRSIDMQPEAILKIASGTKTTMTLSVSQSTKIGIPMGKTEVRMIGGDKYNVTNRGFLTIEQAGGLQAMLKSEGVDSDRALKYEQTRQWIRGNGKLYVYDIKKIDNFDDDISKLPCE